MFLDRFYQKEKGQFSVNREQGSLFAKILANDFNPLHDFDAKKFVVPGDLLFALTLKELGLMDDMRFTFNGMVTDKSNFQFIGGEADTIHLVDQHEKLCMTVDRQGESNSSDQLIEILTRAYVNFSGNTFPHILVPLMMQNNVMINPSRPLVMYQSMHIYLLHFDIATIELCMVEATLNIQDKRGSVVLKFDLISNGDRVGHGEKQMLLSGLRSFDEALMQATIDNYENRREKFLAQSLPSSD